MKKLDVIIVMAGNSTRFNLPVNKTLYQINKKPLFVYSILTFLKLENIHHIYLVVNDDDYEEVEEIIKQNNWPCTLVKGGATRFKSVKQALNLVDKEHDILIHDGARPLIELDDIKKLIDTTKMIGTLYHDVTDTIKDISTNIKTIDRTKLKAVTTPQYFNKELIETMLSSKDDYTDELQLFEKDWEINFIKETNYNIKVTTINDLHYVESLITNEQPLIGHSFDFHPFEEGRKLILGGVDIRYIYGLKGHSDADCLYHAVAEALLGALGMQDLGTYFPDNDEKYLNIDSSHFIKEVMKLVKQANKKINNIDCMIYLEKPNLKQYKIEMANNIKSLTNALQVSVKATTLEKKGLVGNSEGIAVEVVCLLTNK